jgi:hypothetical protein
MKERILCAAIWYKGRIPFCGFWHKDILDLMKPLFPDVHQEIVDNERNRGFLTSENKFADRNLAYIIAKEAGQLRIIHDDTPILTSEDLY